ncbi:pentapeptide repeat-containing protein [Oscillatoria sp. CS-180]|uniref:pentapeptide repeat-containing protein n=1 Tax=Oscillatoria sp. CS-180 TaxID=3021720 RepID=UPI00232C5CC3|nr:pentapeptide repeat-containing protein [Oscillatoria sp. CS-180]MDB9526269.1 pentapeptide repeat-containing protein [Oscillatoria sp. CS-180]
MANQAQLERLKRSVQEWNQWRQDNPGAAIDLSGAHLERADLRDANLSSADLRETKLRKSTLAGADLSGANLLKADLGNTDLTNADLSSTNLNGIHFNHANLVGANLCRADLNGAHLFHTTLRAANLTHAHLNCADLTRADLSNAHLSSAHLSNANLSRSIVLDANFRGMVLTGACITDWQISSSTIFDNIQCDYIFRSYNSDIETFKDRLPVDPNSTFKPSEFEQWIKVRQGAVDTIDITFTEGIDWQAFFQSLQTVRQQHPDAAVRMQSVQEVNGTYVASLQLETEIFGEALDQLKADVESEVKASYALQLASVRGEAIALERSLDNAMEKLAMTSKYTIHGNVGNLADTDWGEMKATIDQNYGTQGSDIIQLLTSLRETAQSFPDEHKEVTQLQFEDLTNDVARQQPSPARIKTRIIGLLGVAIALGGCCRYCHRLR